MLKEENNKFINTLKYPHFLQRETLISDLYTKQCMSITVTKQKSRSIIRPRRSQSLIELEISSSQECWDRLDILLVFEVPQSIPFQINNTIRGGACAPPLPRHFSTTPVRGLVSTLVEPRSGRHVPFHATFIASSILHAQNNNVCIYYEK